MQIHKCFYYFIYFKGLMCRHRRRKVLNIGGGGAMSENIWRGGGGAKFSPVVN